MFYGLGLGLGAGAGCANALGCDSPLSCGLFCRHRGVDHGYWGAAQTQNGNSLAGAGQGDPGAIQAALLSQQNVAHQATGLPAFAFAGIGASHQSIALVPVPVTSSYTNLHRIEDCDRLSMVFLPGEIIAWRCWRPDRPMTGKIGGNYAGVHAWKEREAARIMFEENMAGAGAWGAVALWGELVEHERGFRAENARVVANRGGPAVASRTYPRARHRPLAAQPVARSLWRGIIGRLCDRGNRAGRGDDDDIAEFLALMRKFERRDPSQTWNAPDGILRDAETSTLRCQKYLCECY